MGSIRLAMAASRPHPQYMDKVKRKDMSLITWKPNMTCMNKKRHRFAANLALIYLIVGILGGFNPGCYMD